MAFMLVFNSILSGPKKYVHSELAVPNAVKTR